MNKFFEGLNEYVVTLVEDADISEDEIIFECQAEDKDHAEEQCLNAYPLAVIIHLELAQVIIMELFFNIIVSTLVLSTLISYSTNMIDFNRISYYSGNIAIVSFFVCMVGNIADIAYLIYNSL